MRLATLRLKAQQRHHLLQIFPDLALRVRIAQKIGRMVGGDQFRASEIEPFSAEAGNALASLEQGLGRTAAEAADDFRLDHGELTHQKRRAGSNFFPLGQSVFWRAAFDNVTDVNISETKAYRLDHLREQFSCATDERLTLFVFIAPRPFTNEDDFRLWIPDAEDDLGARLM